MRAAIVSAIVLAASFAAAPRLLAEEACTGASCPPSTGQTTAPTPTGPTGSPAGGHECESKKEPTVS